MLDAGDARLDQTVPPQTKADAGRRTRRNILGAATSIFAEKGYSGANLNEIVVQAGTTKPMIYYHFGSKEGLFAAVLEDIYASMREIEGGLELAGLSAADAMVRLIESTFDYHANNPDWIRLISVANIHDAQHIAHSPTIAAGNSLVLAVLQSLLERGARERVFRTNVDPFHLHLLIASFCFYRVSNRHTWKVIFKRDLHQQADVARQRAMVVEAVMRFLAVGPGWSPAPAV